MQAQETTRSARERLSTEGDEEGKKEREREREREGGRRGGGNKVRAAVLRQQVELIDKDSIFRVDVPT